MQEAAPIGGLSDASARGNVWGGASWLELQSRPALSALACYAGSGYRVSIAATLCICGICKTPGTTRRRLRERILKLKRAR
jgi:hypothetical protein